ncbi:hypothetical protein [Candidatus Cyanaurora vandensis]|uniref:hypothetical protein n=1 Tax=Candidatus Cyanaurora vandensis TaxID=2714958 RepID=UPI00258119DF|nr:hypothetical protein [Candidatus Cyanaurora vandensis]
MIGASCFFTSLLGPTIRDGSISVDSINEIDTTMCDEEGWESSPCHSALCKAPDICEWANEQKQINMNYAFFIAGVGVFAIREALKNLKELQVEE